MTDGEANDVKLGDAKWQAIEKKSKKPAPDPETRRAACWHFMAPNGYVPIRHAPVDENGRPMTGASFLAAAEMHQVEPRLRPERHRLQVLLAAVVAQRSCDHIDGHVALFAAVVADSNRPTLDGQPENGERRMDVAQVL